jgi:hypothetical protein
MNKTIDEIIKAKKEIEREIKELLSDFQTESGCRVTSVDLTFTHVLGTMNPVITSTELVVQLPRS